MKKNEVLRTKDGIFRILKVDEDKILAIDCKKKTMPKFYPAEFFDNTEKIDDIFLVPQVDFDSLSKSERSIAQQRFSMIAGALSVIDDEKKRSEIIYNSSKLFGVCKATVRKYLCEYLVSQNIASLAYRKSKEKELTKDQKNFRWALNKFFYTQNKKPLSMAYAMMLKSKYCDLEGVLVEQYPSFNQFRYFYRKTKRMENFYIKRDGIKAYQRNNRPLLGDGIQEFAPCIGTALLDTTICDIFLVDETGNLIGRPILVAACDANSSLCLGYSLLWEGGNYSLQTLMLNILEDKVSLCQRMGINISKEQWDVNQLPSVLVTDCGSEYRSQQFSQITGLGVSVINLQPFRPDLKGGVEKFFDLIQSSYKEMLKGKGVIMPDFRSRVGGDYRKHATLTLDEFEKIIVRCIVYYNCERIVKNYPYTSEMLKSGVKPFANEIWNFRKREEANNLISVTSKELILTLLPRTTGKFTRFGLKVNGLKYYADGYTEQFLSGEEGEVSYDPNNCGKVWLKEKSGDFVEFLLIEKRFFGMSFEDADNLKADQKVLETNAIRENYTAKINLLSFIETVASKPSGDVKIKGTRKAKQSSKRKSHKDLAGELNG